MTKRNYALSIYQSAALSAKIEKTTSSSERRELQRQLSSIEKQQAAFEARQTGSASGALSKFMG